MDKEKMIVFGIDPGANGFVTMLSGDTAIVKQLPVYFTELKTINKKSGKPKKRSFLNAVGFITLMYRLLATGINLSGIKETDPIKIIVAVEKEHSWSSDGNVQAFSFGANYGAILAVLALWIHAVKDNYNIEVKQIMLSSTEWKQIMGIPRKKKITKTEKNKLVWNGIKKYFDGRVSSKAYDSIGIALAALLPIVGEDLFGNVFTLNVLLV